MERTSRKSLLTVGLQQTRMGVAHVAFTLDSNGCALLSFSELVFSFTGIRWKSQATFCAGTDRTLACGLSQPPLQSHRSHRDFSFSDAAREVEQILQGRRRLLQTDRKTASSYFLGSSPPLRTKAPAPSIQPEGCVQIKPEHLSLF